MSSAFSRLATASAAVTLALVVWPQHAHAENGASTETPAPATAADDWRSVNVGLRGSAAIGLYQVGWAGVSLEAQAAVNRFIAVGGQLGAFRVDAGADPMYCGCVREGAFLLAYGELSLPRPWKVSPILRLGAGVANRRGNDDAYRPVDGYTPGAYTEIGGGLELWHFYSRLGASVLVAGAAIPGLSLAIGARF